MLRLAPLVLQNQQLMCKKLDDFCNGDTARLGPLHMLNIVEAFHIEKLPHQSEKLEVSDGGVSVQKVLGA